ncbi:MAG: tRNA adenosine(34) deaminase TadA [Methylophilaceae bacterium]|nr:tRNA adenosine(34) deaminase TadA [Methylophilaceae bacterium]MBL6726216.1 tRNA adenosine(34) deaminase TadA [Methylophilaceae bacterium]MBL6728271.1 tRNA adenosine(34) deaminase TadA [Methylophilaceae bacterium]MBL6790871.1 tRNA adenosine(34) deaminase TadA [Methylophilaceae bacterium]
MNLNTNHEYFMSLAIDMAKKSLEFDEVPVGAIVVKNNEVIGRGYNSNLNSNDPTAHAEINAIKEASKFLNNYRLPNCSLYVTLEPCIMCLGAIFHARISHVFFSANDLKTGACGGFINLINNRGLNHHCEFSSGLLSNQTSTLLTNFFKSKRQKKPQN